MKIEEHKIKLGKEDIFYLYKSSSSTATNTVIFIHGFPFSSAMWRAQLESLPESIQGFAFDISGFGHSSAEHHFFSVELFARKVFALMDEWKVEKAILCGLSMGGYIALRAAEIDLERIGGLILCDTHSLADTNDGKLKRFASIDQVISGKKAEFASSFLKNLFAEGSFTRQRAAVNLIESIILNTSDATMCAAQLALASRTDTSSVLEKIKVPALIVRGEQDKIMSHEHLTQLCSGIKGSEKLIVPDAGHLPNLENATIFNYHFKEFLIKHFS